MSWRPGPHPGSGALAGGTADPVTAAPITADPGTADPGTAGADGNPTTLAQQRRALIDLVIYAYDRAGTGVRARLAYGLHQVGARLVQPDGELFDAVRHEAGGIEPTDDAALVGRIAETERAGFVDGERVIREPIVVVYRRR